MTKGRRHGAGREFTSAHDEDLEEHLCDYCEGPPVRASDAVRPQCPADVCAHHGLHHPLCTSGRSAVKYSPCRNVLGGCFLLGDVRIVEGLCERRRAGHRAHASTRFGKLLFNVLLTLSLVFGVTIVYTVAFPGFTIQSPDIFLTTVILGSLGLASAATIIAAIIAKANSRGTLYPVLSFPILIVLLMSVMNATAKALDGEQFVDAAVDFLVLISYVMVITAGSYLLFDHVWKD